MKYTYTRFLEYLVQTADMFCQSCTIHGKSCLKRIEVLLLTSFYSFCSHGRYNYNIIINYKLLNKRSYMKVTIVINTRIKRKLQSQNFATVNAESRSLFCSYIYYPHISWQSRAGILI